MVTARLLGAWIGVAVAAAAAGEGREPRIGGDSTPLLELYGQVYGWGESGFSCVPAVYAGGPEAPGYASERRRLDARRQRAAKRLSAAFGAAAIDRIERAYHEEEASVYRTGTGCDPEAARRDRARYRVLLERLERRTARLKGGRER